MLGYLVRVFYDYSSPTRASLGLGTYALRPQRDIAHGERASCKALAAACWIRASRRLAATQRCPSGMELVPEDATAPVMGEVLQPEQRERAPVAAGEVEVTTEQPEAAGDELLSTDEISGEYSAPGCVDFTICNSMTVVPHGPDMIETWRAGCLLCPLLCIGPMAQAGVRTRKPGTNVFLDPQNPYTNVMTFSADGTATQGCGNFKKRPGSQKRAFQKVDARDLAGKWRGCFCIPAMLWPLSGFYCTGKKALNQDQYEESGRCGFLLTLCLPLIPVSATRTREYVNGHPTNLFDDGIGILYRDPGCALGGLKFAKKTG